ncbi:hypothetical protein HALLA_00165 (plasmid) [Halostagnicola larsenii XH-48]|uniref:Uncharacterized protein n=1 Tax=Halostagnicola larsenii XH-48 TaxID=797299 RepID=W0JWQ6_9EURY|nr:hypothetical protein HALLA_00165 [Halostagnicola larsenii XH-48]
MTGASDDGSEVEVETTDERESAPAGNPPTRADRARSPNWRVHSENEGGQ